VFEGRPGRHQPAAWLLTVTASTVLMLSALGVAPAAAATYPILPEVDWSPILGGLVGPTLSPGASGHVTFRLADPLPVSLVSAKVYLQIYAFNPTDGGAVQPPPTGVSPTFPGASLENNATAPPQIPPGTSWNWSVPVSVPRPAPTGDYAVRISVSFSMNNSSYLLESRGFFSASEWTGATQYANGTPTINASELGVSGVVPETSILVSGSTTPIVLYAVLGVGLGLAGVGAYWWTRSETKSKSGARRPSPPQSAPTAFGNSRRSDGD
jgi:hypothetical protein